MAYKKYIKRGGKLYGPYIYHSKRVDGKVVSEYHGPKKEINYKNFILIGAGILFLLAVAYLISTGKFSSGTGNAILDLNANYQQGQPLSGKLSMSLQQGELIPTSSQIIFDNNGKISQYALKDLIADETQQGDFYVSGSSLSGAGDGYGLIGKKEIFPEVSFTLNILSESTNSSDVVSENVSSTENTNSTDSNNSGILDVVSNFFLSLTPTGHAIVEFESQIQGTVSTNESFVYDLQPGQRAELQPLSAFSGDNQLSDNIVSLTTEGNQVIVTTDYSENSEGFGQDYLGAGQKNIDIDLSKTGFVPEEGNLKISFVDGSTEIISLETVLQSSGSVSANKTVEETPVVNENPVEVTQTTTEQNQTLVVSSPVEISLPAELTTAEKLTLAEEFGDVPVTIGEAKEKNGVLVVKYELGNYWIENSYSVDLTKEELNTLMQQDVILWQKDLAKRLSEAKAPEEADVPGIVGTNFSLVG